MHDSLIREMIVEMQAIHKKTEVKLERANGGSLGTQRRRRTWLPTKRSGELETSKEPEISEWGNPEAKERT